ncbi:methyltransferase protein [Metarhizium rileyi]|uniref:Protein arginine N-methyltransferase n=1 Tax=Metarhizium rileyi (strain RCEF 4871) TaxID=1649241 RepID=A0A5C6GPL1_METRR|nr:methyltransferase protein [Metarhizium rileyi]
MAQRLPYFNIAKHDSKRDGPLTDLQYGYLLNQGLNSATTPVTNGHFRSRVFKLVSDHLKLLADNKEESTSIGTGPRADPIIPPLTPDDTGMVPSPTVSTYTAYISPWVDLCSTNPLIASISRQVLNLEVNYANFCGVRSIIIAGPSRDASLNGGNQALAQYSRAVQEVLTIGSALTVVIHMPMYREPITGQKAETLSSLLQERSSDQPASKEVDLFAAWASWHHVRSICSYNFRLLVALQMPRVMAEKDLQTRWFAEPLQYLTIGPEVFQKNKSGFPSLSKQHQEMMFSLMRLKAAPWILLCDVGPDASNFKVNDPEILSVANRPALTGDDFPSLADAAAISTSQTSHSGADAHMAYLQWLESRQPPMTALESSTLTSFQDWLQSPLQPLSDNLESATYEVFEGDPVKYDQYEAAVIEALTEWKELDLPTSKEGVVVIAVAGSGRGPLVTRAMKAAEYTGVEVEIWAVEKNPNAYVYLLRQNQILWGGKVNVVKTDMRAWKGPVAHQSSDGPIYGKVDILISELLGSFGDNELSPECLDGIQHVIAKPHGISIPRSYTAHMSPVSTPKVYGDLLARSATETTAFNTPWVVRLYALDYVCQKVPDHPRFQQAWEFSHPIPESTLANVDDRRSGGIMGGGGGSMAGAAGANDHNSRYCHVTFVCRSQGVTHGLAGYFESTLYESKLERQKGEKVEISTHPERIDQKSKDMISWFPIFFPLKEPISFPADTELEVSMWRQTDDTKVWYEWLVEAWTWIGESSRIKRVGYYTYPRPAEKVQEEWTSRWVMLCRVIE